MREHSYQKYDCMCTCMSMYDHESEENSVQGLEENKQDSETPEDVVELCRSRN